MLERWGTGAERFVTGIAVEEISLSVRSAPGGADLKTATVYSGLGKVLMQLRPSLESADSRRVPTHSPLSPPCSATLILSSLLVAAQKIARTILFNAVIQKQLVLVVEDTAGKRAVSFPFRSIKAGTRGVVFCGDHTNGAAMAHGVTTLPVLSWTVPMPDEQVRPTLLWPRLRDKRLSPSRLLRMLNPVGAIRLGSRGTEVRRRSASSWSCSC